MIDYQEVVKYFENKLNTGANRNRRKYYKTAISAMQELRMYKELGTLEEVREAVEKQKRKKPRATTNRCYVCPHCGLVTSIKIKHNYCDACGQHINWSDKE